MHYCEVWTPYICLLWFFTEAISAVSFLVVSLAVKPISPYQYLWIYQSVIGFVVSCESKCPAAGGVGGGSGCRVRARGEQGPLFPIMALPGLGQCQGRRYDFSKKCKHKRALSRRPFSQGWYFISWSQCLICFYWMALCSCNLSFQ